MIGPRLKTETADAHIRLEQHDILANLGDGVIARDDYITILQKFLPFWQAVEQTAYARADVAALLPDIHSRILSPLMQRDLAYLGAAPMAGPLPVIDWVHDVPSAMGTIYVLEGSTLGGRVISKRLYDQLGVTADAGAAYYNGYGAETGAMWKAFQMAIHGANFDDAACDAIVAAATTTFNALYDWLGAPNNAIAQAA